MTVVRAARPDELPALAYGGDAQATYLDGLLASGCTRHEWCLVAERDGRLVGNVVLWTMPGNATPMDIVLLDAADETTARILLDEAAAAAKGAGATIQGHALDSPRRRRSSSTTPRSGSGCSSRPGSASPATAAGSAGRPKRRSPTRIRA